MLVVFVLIGAATALVNATASSLWMGAVLIVAGIMLYIGTRHGMTRRLLYLAPAVILIAIWLLNGGWAITSSAVETGWARLTAYVAPAAPALQPTQTAPGSQLSSLVQPGQQPPANSTNADGFGGIITADAKTALGIDVQRLRTEASAFVWRSIPVSVQATCPTGWTCTLHLKSGEVKLFVGDGKNYDIVAGTFRRIQDYPANDAVHGNPPCDLLAKEVKFGLGENPTFPVTAGNFTCTNQATTQIQPTAAAPAQQPTAVDKKSQVSTDWLTKNVGGTGWKKFSDDGCSWKYAAGSAAVTMKWPGFGVVNTWNSKIAKDLSKAGDTQTGVNEATFQACIGD
jgi:hypothetical protein